MKNVTESTDFSDSDQRRCPLAGENQSWESYSTDLKLWTFQTTLEKSKIAPHIITRGIQRNATFMRKKELLDIGELTKDSGFDYLCAKMGELTHEQDNLLKYKRYEAWTALTRRHGEKIDEFLTRWTVAFNKMKAEKFAGDIPPHLAALQLLKALVLTEAQFGQISALIDLDSASLTIDTLTNAINKTQVIPAQAASVRTSTSGAHQASPALFSGDSAGWDESESWEDWSGTDPSYWIDWTPEHGYLTLESSDVFDEQSGQYVSVFWSEVEGDYVCYDDTQCCYIAYNQCRICGARDGHWARDCPLKGKGKAGKGSKSFGKGRKGKSFSTSFSHNAVLL